MEYIVSVGRPEEMESLGCKRLVRCKNCIFWKPNHVKQNDGTERPYTDEEKRGDGFLICPCVSTSVGINVGAQCFVEYNTGWNEDKTVFRCDDDYCSRAIERPDGISAEDYWFGNNEQAGEQE